MSDLAKGLLTATRSSVDRVRRTHESGELLGMLGGGLWAALIFVVVHFGTN